MMILQLPVNWLFGSKMVKSEITVVLSVARLQRLSWQIKLEGSQPQRIFFPKWVRHKL